MEKAETAEELLAKQHRKEKKDLQGKGNSTLLHFKTKWDALYSMTFYVFVRQKYIQSYSNIVVFVCLFLSKNTEYEKCCPQK